MIAPELIPRVAERFRALGDPARLAILAALQDGERAVGDLVQATGRSQPNVSQHLASLAKVGFVVARREGNKIFYRCADPCLQRICDAVCESLVARAEADEKWLKVLRSRRRKSAATRA
jgi:DNA-binding transcriptional ArsR family regulator